MKGSVGTFTAVAACALQFLLLISAPSSLPIGVVLAKRESAFSRRREREKVVPRRPLVVKKEQLNARTVEKIDNGKNLNRRERKELAKIERLNYHKMRHDGADEVSNSEQAVLLRNYKLRNKKRKGLLRKRPASLASVLFPGVSPNEFVQGQPISMHVDLVESKKTQVPFEYYDLPSCPMPKETTTRRKHRERRNLGSHLQGHSLKPAPYTLNVKRDMPCTVLCMVALDSKKLRWMRKLVERQYRVQLQLDSLPVLMRSLELNYAARGYPVGFKSPPKASSTPTKSKSDYFLYNHLKFAITYHEDPEAFDGVRITGFDVHPVSIDHNAKAVQGPLTTNTQLDTCQGMDVENDASRYMELRMDSGESKLPIIYSYDVQWIENSLTWADRWDVYLVGAPDDGIHYYSIVNSLMIVLFMTGAITTIMIRTLRKDIAGYNELQTLEEAQEETGWKLIHGDVFRPPQFSPMILSVLVGTGAQIGVSFALAMLCAIFKLTNSMNKGQILTSLIFLYVLSGFVAGYVSARIYKFCEAKAWKRNAILTATALPGTLVAMFSVLNIFLRFAGAATAVSFLTILCLFLLWVCVSAPLVLAGGFVGLKAPKIEVPTKTNQIARIIPEAGSVGTTGVMNPFVTMCMGGILPFGSVCIELAFIMSALWLHQIYYVMGFLLAVLLILAATCAQVSIVLCYLQLCAEDHRWWWKSFWNCATAGVYLFLYSLWFLSSRLDLVGFLPVIIYLTYMSMISVCFGLFCGAVGFLSSFWFTKTIYGAVKVD